MDGSAASDNSKSEQLRELAEKRKLGYEGYGNLSDFEYECDFVSPYTKCARNEDSPIFIMLQDWGSADGLRPFSKEIEQCGRDPGRATNVNLDKLLKDRFNIDISETYASNLFPFIKPGGMNRPIPRRDLVYASKLFGRPQIEIVAPRLVIALGLACFSALREAYGLKPVRTVKDAVLNPICSKDLRICYQAHTSPLGQNNRKRGDLNRVTKDWQAMADWFHNGPKT